MIIYCSTWDDAQVLCTPHSYNSAILMLLNAAQFSYTYEPACEEIYINRDLFSHTCIWTSCKKNDELVIIYYLIPRDVQNRKLLDNIHYCLFDMHPKVFHGCQQCAQTPYENKI